jgi:hypothetical protein
VTWTYNPESLGTDLAKVRNLIGDTNTNDKLLTDEEIAVYQALETNLFSVAALCCDAIIAKLARDIDRSNLGMSAQRSQKIQHYQDMRDRYLAKAASGAGGVFFGGADVSENAKIDSDPDATKPEFELGQFDNKEGLS